MKKRIASAVLALLMAMTVLAGCGAESTAPAESKETETTPAASSEVKEDKGDKGEKVKLTYLNWNGGEEMRLQQEAIDEYMEKNPNVEIVPQWVPENYDSKINTLVAANETPDIYYINEYLAVDWGEKGVAADLAPLFSDLGVNMVETYLPSAVFPYGDKVYGVATGPVTGLLYYNKPLFDAAGVEYPSMDPHNPWTWDEMIAAAEKLTSDGNGKRPTEEGFKDKQIKTYGVMVPTFWLFDQPLLYSAGAGFANEDATGTGLDSEGGRLFLESMYNAFNVNKVAPNTAIAKTMPGLSQAFKNNQLAMAIDGTWQYANFMAEEIDFGVAPLPTMGENGKPVNISWAATFQMAEICKNKPEAAKFLEFLTNPEKNPRQLQINFPNTYAYYEDEEKFNSWIEGGNFKDDFKEIIPTIMSEIAIVPENVTVKNFNKVVNEISAQELDAYFAMSQDLETTLNNIKTKTEGEWQGKWA